MRAIPALFAGVLLVASVASADTAEWAIDSSHSKVGFSISHLVVSSVDGKFNSYTGKVNLDEADLTKSNADLTIKVASIDTGDAKRDEHLKSPDFFDAAKFPEITFKSTKVVKAGAGYKLTGDLKIKDVTKSVTLDATVSAPIKSPWGKQVRGTKFKGKIKRGDFGLKWNKALETGGVVVGEEVTFDIALEINK